MLVSCYRGDSVESSVEASSRFRTVSASTIIIMVSVLAATLVILVSLYCMRSFLLRFHSDSEQTFQEFSRRKRRFDMHKRITVACLASLSTLAVSYIPLITAILIWCTQGRQSGDVNAVAHVLCSVAHTINPIIAIATSGRVQKAFVSVLKMVQPFKTLLKRFPSFNDNHLSVSLENTLLNYGTANGESPRSLQLEENFLNDLQCDCEETMANEQVFSNKIIIHVVSENGASLRDHVAEIKKKPLTRQRSLSAGCQLLPHSHEDTNYYEKRNLFNLSDSKIYKPLESYED